MESEAQSQTGPPPPFQTQLDESDLIPKPVFTIPGVVHFLQHEWSRFERERSNWEVERAELKSRIAFLQGERKGQENLKRDLVRRIKMLEFALKQERKGHRLTSGTDANGAESPPKLKKDHDNRDRRIAAASEARQVTLRQGRQLLRQYLQEIGYTDSMINVRSSRVRSLLNLNAFGDGSPGGLHTPFGVVPSTPLVRSMGDVDGGFAGSRVIGRRPEIQSSSVMIAKNLPGDKGGNEKVVHTSSVKVTLQSRAVPSNKSPLSPTKPSSPTRVDELDPIGVPDSTTTYEEAEDEEDEESIVASFNFLEDLDNGQEDEENQAENGEEKGSQAMTDFLKDSLLDEDTEAAMAEFDFLENEGGEDTEEGNPEDNQEDVNEEGSRKGVKPLKGDHYDAAQVILADSGHREDTSVLRPMKAGKDRLTKLKEKYKEDRKKKKKPGQRPARSELRDMMKTLSGDDPAGLPASLQAAELHHNTEGGASGDGMSPPSFPIDADEMEVGMPGISPRGIGSKKGRRSKVLGIDGIGSSETELLTASLGLGDLAGLSIVNEIDPLFDTGSKGVTTKKVWNPRFSLRSHFDGVRSLAFHPESTLVVTTSEDSTLKLWNAQKPSQVKKASIFDLEPLYAFRGHCGPVWCCSISSCGRYVFSGSSDKTICRWLLPPEDCDPFGSYGSCQELTDDFCVVMNGHTDSVWSLSVLENDVIASCSADGTIRLWNHTAPEPLLATVNATEGQPTSISSVLTEPNHCVFGHTSGRAVVMDVERQQPVVTLDGSSDLPGLQQINQLVCHPTLPVTITAHEDRHMRFFDHKSGKQIHSMVAHMDAVTCVAVDPNGLFVVSGSHDCSLRLWNYETKTCVQEMTSHRKKFEESVCDVAFHSTRPMIGSAGADGIVKVFM